MNNLFLALGIEGWKPMVSALLLPPAPFLLAVLLGAWWLRRSRLLLGWTALLSGLFGVWAMCTTVVGFGLVRTLTTPPPALDSVQVARLARAPRTAIVVLGAGIRFLAPEYGGADLRPLTLERLRYGLWLSRQTSLPVAFSGGIGLGRTDGPTEAETARRVAQRDFGVNLRWLETLSRDTNENALYSVRLLHREGIEHIVLVTHGFHQRRATAAFQRAIGREAVAMDVVSATMGWGAPSALTAAHFVPTAEGFSYTRWALHEWLGRMAGA